jgi:SAM-dependent methyltransferase
VVTRDTDADWRELGATEPYWGVITHPDYKTANLTPEAIETFYASGVDYIAGMVETLTRTTGARPGGRALDFGCGTGRLAEALCAHADHVVGYDISPGMLEKARARGGATYVDSLPPGPFDWINSFIVFQHIEPDRGLALMEDLLSRLAVGGHVSLHLTIWRDPRHMAPPPRGWARFLPPGLVERRRLARHPAGIIMMHDYDLSAVVRLLNRAGVAEMTLISTDHDGHHGVIVLGRKSA